MEFMEFIEMPIELAGRDGRFRETAAIVEDGTVIWEAEGDEFEEIPAGAPVLARTRFVVELSRDGRSASTWESSANGESLDFRRLDDSLERFAELPMLVAFSDHGARRDCVCCLRESDYRLCVWRIMDDGSIVIGPFDDGGLERAKLYALSRIEVGGDGRMSVRRD